MGYKYPLNYLGKGLKLYIKKKSIFNIRTTLFLKFNAI
jgi:hypothetical protein